MSIHAHPDDQDFTVAGTLAKWARAGCDIISVIITSGDAGSNDPDRSPEYKAELARVREQEQSQANAVLGVRDTVFMRYPDGELTPSLELRRDLTRLIRRHGPEVVITGDPTAWFYENDYINHPDHRAAATAALDATFPAAGQPNLFEELEAEGLKAHKPRKVYVTAWSAGEVYVNIEETIDLKIKALRAHQSQMRDWDPTEMIKTWAREAAKGKEMEYAENYRVVTLVPDADWEKTRGAV